MTQKKKLIEVALPLDAINKASAREKSIRHGHPSTLHLWWARRPLAAARAVIFAQMVDDPSAYVDVLISDSKTRRAAKLFQKSGSKPFSCRPAPGGIRKFPGTEGPMGPERDRVLRLGLEATTGPLGGTRRRCKA